MGFEDEFLDKRGKGGGSVKKDSPISVQLAPEAGQGGLQEPTSMKFLPNQSLARLFKYFKTRGGVEPVAPTGIGGQAESWQVFMNSDI